MKYNAEKREILLDRELNKLDTFVLDFTSLLDEYVLVSGYVSILFGRARATEDIDLLVPRLEKPQFIQLWKKILKNGFECINTSKPEEAFEMLSQNAIRFARKGKPVPNMEFKLIKNAVDAYSFDNRIRVRLNKGVIYISPMEMQIVYKKLYLRSEKDMEDALHLEELFKDALDNGKINKSTMLVNTLIKEDERKG